MTFPERVVCHKAIQMYKCTKQFDVMHLTFFLNVVFTSEIHSRLLRHLPSFSFILHQDQIHNLFFFSGISIWNSIPEYILKKNILLLCFVEMFLDILHFNLNNLLPNKQF